jgi:asparagine synthase (glutamine-hydrolysing)
MEDAPPLKDEPVGLIRSVLEELGELVIRSDVPVGVALSGGLDSSAIAALAAKRYPDTMHAFCVGYPGHLPGDERREAKALADHLSMPFHDVELTQEDMVAFFPELNYWRDDPIADISGYGYYAVTKLAREHNVPVLLQGQGGDELFWGYAWLQRAAQDSVRKAALWKQGWRALPAYLCPKRTQRTTPWRPRDGLSALAQVWRGGQRFWRDRTGPMDRMVFYDLAPDFSMAMAEANTLYTAGFRERLGDGRATDLFTHPHPWPPIDIRLTRLVSELYLRENGIAQGDRLSMASSVELRLPLVDHRLVETVIGLRKTYEDLHLPPKGWLKASLRDILPDWVLDRPKRGFAPPVREWYAALFATYGSYLEHGYLVEAGILNPASCHVLAQGPVPVGAVIPLSFKALVLETWCRQMQMTQMVRTP